MHDGYIYDSNLKKIRICRTWWYSTFNLSTEGGEVGKSLSLRPIWSIGEAELHEEALLGKQKEHVESDLSLLKLQCCSLPVTHLIPPKQFHQIGTKYSNMSLWEPFSLSHTIKETTLLEHRLNNLERSNNFLKIIFCTDK